jgi:peptidoglycan/xylan/chitin deacetylase (PgdA/CDA1 family)/glycosyltransferase involved in cell wall biosynthesis
MRSTTGKILSDPEVQPPVFEDLSGLRMRRVKYWARFAFFGTLVWALAIAVVVLDPGRMSGGDDVLRGKGPATITLAGQDVDKTDADMLIDAKAPAGSEPPNGGFDTTSAQRPRCVSNDPAAGAALASSGPAHPLRVYALLPNDAENAFLPLLRNCSRVDVIMPEWFEIGGPSLSVSKTDIDAEMQDALASIRVERHDDIQIWPVVSLGNTVTASDFLARLGDSKMRSVLVGQMIEAAVGMKAQAACLRLRDVKPADANVLEPFLAELKTGARAKGLDLCLVASLSDQLWTSQAVVSHFDKVIVTAYQEPWIGAHPQPLAPLEWFRQQLVAIQSDVPEDKLVIAVGGHAVDWVSGLAVPERISIAEAMFRIADANAAIDYAPTARNSFSTFFDRSGNRHQIWMLDAASVHNSLEVMQELGIYDLAIPSLGEEEPAYWDMLDGNLASGEPYSFGAPAFPDNVAFVGQGAFYRFDTPSRPGRRLWRLDQDGRFIESLYYEVIPRPVQMERYGLRAPKQIALTFDDGPDAVATSQILDALKSLDAPATFFVVGKAALSSPDLLTRAVDEGHVIGSHSFSHPHMEDLGPFMARTELSANRNLIEGVIGRSPLLYRPPYIRGPGPLNEIEAMAFAVPEEEGYFVAGSDVVPTDWAGASATDIVKQVIGGLEKTGGNVIVLHDGRSTGMHTAEAVSLLVPELRARGYEIVALPVLLGSTSAAAMPRVGLTTSVFKGLSVTLIALWIAFLTIIFWICIFASVLRSAMYLYLSSRRDPIYPRSFVRARTVTVLVPAYNEEKVIVSTVRSVLNSDYPGLSCVVVDDGSTDATLAILMATFGADPRVKVLTQPNQGKWRALNLAFQSIDTEIAVCVDADTRISPHAIAEIVRPFADSKVAAVAGTVVVANSSNLLTQFQSVEYITAQQIGRRAQEHLNGILVVPGALGAWRVEAVRDVGFFSNETLTEDADLTIWLRRGGHRVAYAENARSYTEAPTDVRSLLKQRLRWSFGNLQTLWKHRKAIFEFGPKRLFSMLDMAFFGYVLPIISPILDMLFLYFLTNLVLDWHSGRISDGVEISHLAVFGVVMVQVMDIVVAWIAHQREGMPKLQLLYLIPLMNLFYRPLLYITVYRALWAALSGRLARWNKLRRKGVEPLHEAVAR